jgi:hypothetical protein
MSGTLFQRDPRDLDLLDDLMKTVTSANEQV